ncbi:MAG: ABC transporter permease [Opitutaceae bacterium]
MHWLRKFRWLFRRSQAEADMAEEMRFHLEQRTAEHLADGLAPDEARNAAQRRFGNLASLKEQAREVRGWRWADELPKDLRFAMRQLRKSPGFTTVAILTLALGIGANTAIFSAIDAVLLRPQPYPESERLVNVFERLPSGEKNSVSGSAFIDWRDHQTKFESLFLYAYDALDLTGLGEPEKINALSVTSAFDRVLGVTPLLGRGFRPDDDQVGGRNSVVIVTERFWRVRLGASPTALGQMLQLDGVPHEIVGVMPDRAWFHSNVAIFVPYALWPGSYRTSHEVNRAHVLGRLARGVSLAQAQAELNSIKQGLQSTYPAHKRTWGVTLQPMHDVLAQESKPVLLLLLGAVGLVLLIACANVANLLLARASTRQREIAVRAALGASGSRLVRQVVTESLLLSLLGGAGGVLLAVVSVHFLGTLGSRFLPATMTPQVDLRVLGFSLLASCGTGLLFGIFPALRVRRPDLNPALASGSRGATDTRVTRSQSSLVVAEVALTVLLLVGTGLLVRSLVRAVTADPGINPRNVLMFGLTLPYGGKYGNAEKRLAFLDRVTEEIRALPGVSAVATTDDLPFSQGGQGYFYSLEERPETRQERVGAIKYTSPGYLETLGAHLVRGRFLTAADNRPDAPRVLVINQRLVEVLFGDADPIGRRLSVANQAWEIIGVVADMRVDGLPTPPRPTFYAAQAHFPWGSAFMVRTHGDPWAAASAVSAAVHRLDAGLPLDQLRTLEQAMEESLGPQKLILNLIGAFAAAALLLASIGLYGVMSYAVANRQREMSIRLALGATRRDILRLVVGGGVRWVGVGLGVGLLLAIAGARLLANRLTTVNAGDPPVFLGATLILAAVTLLACWLPAWRAAKADPMTALRAD